MADERCPGAPASRRGGRWALSTPAIAPRFDAGLQEATNLSAATARVLSPLPYSEVNQLHLGAYPLFEVWYRLNAPTGSYQFGFQASPEPAVDYAPRVSIYTGTPSALTSYLLTGEEGPVQIPVTPGTSYFFQVSHAGPAIGPADLVFLTVTTRVGLNILAPEGSILINDDRPDFPLVVLPGAGGVATPMQSRPFPAGETAVVLPNGISIWSDKTDLDHLALYDATLTRLATPVWTHSDTSPALSSNRSNRFYAADGSSLVSVSDAGVLGPTTWTLPDLAVYWMAVAHDDTMVYYDSSNTGTGGIKRYDLVASAPLSALTGPVTDYGHTGEILVLGDGSVVVGYNHRPLPSDRLLRRYAADGTLLASYALDFPDTEINRVSPALTDASVWVWLWGTGAETGIDTFAQIQISDGAVLYSYTSPQYSGGVFMGPIESTSVPMGHPFSCPFIIFPPPLPPYGEVPALSYHQVEHPIRRLRRAPHVTNENLRVFYRRFELDLERGQGLATGQGADPMVLLRISRDGGQTWGEEQRLAAGALGAYTQRVIARRLGQARDTVFEVVVSDPIAWSLVGAWLDLEPGTS